MSDWFKNTIGAIKGFIVNKWKPKPSPDSQSPSDKYGQPSQPLTLEQRKQILRDFLTKQVAQGWTIEIENEFDVVLGRKRKFNWGFKLIIFLILLLIFVPLALFYLVVVIIRGVTAKPVRRHYRVNDIGVISKA